MRCFFAIFCLFCVTAMARKSVKRPTPQPPPPPKLSTLPKTVILSFGSFGNDVFTNIAVGEGVETYPELTEETTTVPQLKTFVAASASPASLIPVNPTKTPVNNFSIATGLYAERHGVIDHCLYDEPAGKCDYEQYKLDASVEPVWIENQIQGGISGVSMWSGSQHEYQGRFPIHYEAYKEDVHFKVRLTTMIGWLCDKEQPANLVMGYFGELDKVVHRRPVNSDETNTEIQNVQKTVETFLQMLKDKGIRKYINVIVHGTQGIKTVYEIGGIRLKDILTDVTLCTFISMRTNVIVTPAAGKFQKVYDILQENAKNRYSVYTRDDIPEEWHLKKLALFEEKIFLLAEVNYFFWNENLEKVKADQVVEGYLQENGIFLAGFNGYSNELSVMHSFFAATGPRFKTNTSVKAFETIDIYPLLRELLELNEPSSKKPEGEQLNPETEQLNPETEQLNPETEKEQVPPLTPQADAPESDQRETQHRKTKMVQAVRDMLLPRQPKPIDPPKPIDLPRPIDPPKPIDLPKPIEPPKSRLIEIVEEKPYLPPKKKSIINFVRKYMYRIYRNDSAPIRRV